MKERAWAWTKRLARRLRWVLAALGALYVWARWGPMDPLFTTPRSTVLLDAKGELLAATVADDGQWRMPPSDSIPARFERCLVEFEDRRFRHHWGIHLPSLVRAWQQNRQAGHIVSGGSTITMQVARMACGDRDRNVWNKLVEMMLALRLETRYDKDEILRLYGANAPFGGNVVGLDAAAWRWFGRNAHQLGWAECATLAVLPNAPSRIHPGRNRDALRAKRDRLLDRLLVVQAIDSVQWSLAKEEPLPEKPLALPRSAPHLLTTLQREGLEGQRITTTIDAAVQQRLNELAVRHGPALRANEVHNAAVLVLDVPTGRVLAYMGNLPDADMAHAGMVDIVRAPRSTGSLLKPFLYADMLQSGERMPDQLVPDLPTSYDGFAPRNFDERYDGAVPASQALARSLNVPAVRALREHGVERTRHMLVGMGLRHLDRSAHNYGLSLIMGGGESTLWELTGAYASMARVVLRFSGSDAALEGAVHAPTVVANRSPVEKERPPLNAASLYHTLMALQGVNRPEAETGWFRFAGTERIAWKTGTSYGHRDAWAIGVTDRYAVGVWTGNASGEGRPGLTGTLAAAPLLFELFGALPDGRGFDPPYDGMRQLEVCRASGYRAGPDCEPLMNNSSCWKERERPLPLSPPHPGGCKRNASRCTRKRRLLRSLVLLTARHGVLLCGEPPGLPPDSPMGRWFPDGRSEQPMQMIYPENGAKLFIPIQLSGERGRVVLHAAHQEPLTVIHWDLDGNYLGSTTGDHRMTTSLNDGEHALTLTDDKGAHLNIGFRAVVSEEKE
ncbi:MAG: penicillin-binding protein 1C [Flavobacteriales bacterium]|nr:penicillin-binding protein 1C [Flavobacteriales bacterium]